MRSLFYKVRQCVEALILLVQDNLTVFICRKTQFYAFRYVNILTMPYLIGIHRKNTSRLKRTLPYCVDSTHTFLLQPYFVAENSAVVSKPHLYIFTIAILLIQYGFLKQYTPKYRAYFCIVWFFLNLIYYKYLYTRIIE